jgi:protein-S-isoprenylcysteine O-methyltransferase Ste14
MLGLNADASAPPMGLAARVGTFAFGLIAYAMFVGAFLYAAGFVSGLVVPKTVDGGAWSSTTVTPPQLALPINSALLMLFVIQHTIMARPAFKRWWTRFVSPTIERSIYVAAASASLMLLFWQWRPLPGVVWDVSHIAIAKYGLIMIEFLGYGIALASSFMVSHWDLFGLRQVWVRLINRPQNPIPFRLVGLYKLVRHPLMVGFLIAFWSTPVMTVGHLFFAAMTTGYIFFGTWVEERDLMAQFGDTYRGYRARVRGFVPIPKSQGNR